MKQVIHTDRAPAALGPYSQAIKADCGQIIFLSGQVPLDPKSGEIVGSTAAEQCRQVMSNLGAVLTAAGASLAQVVKTTIYLTDMNDFAAVNEVYGANFRENPPARATVEVCRLPKDARVEIEAIAVL